MIEADVENAALEWFQAIGWGTIHGSDIAPGEPGAERDCYADVVLHGRLCAPHRLSFGRCLFDVCDFSAPRVVRLREQILAAPEQVALVKPELPETCVCLKANVSRSSGSGHGPPADGCNLLKKSWTGDLPRRSTEAEAGVSTKEHVRDGLEPEVHEQRHLAGKRVAHVVTRATGRLAERRHVPAAKRELEARPCGGSRTLRLRVLGRDGGGDEKGGDGKGERDGSHGWIEATHRNGCAVKRKAAFQASASRRGEWFTTGVTGLSQRASKVPSDGHCSTRVCTPNATPRSSNLTLRAPWSKCATDRSLPRRASASNVPCRSGYTSDALTIASSLRTRLAKSHRLDLRPDPGALRRAPADRSGLYLGRAVRGLVTAGHCLSAAQYTLCGP